MRKRGIARARMFFGGMLLFEAVIAWGTSVMTSPHGDTVAPGTQHVRTTVALFMRNGAIGTLILCALAGWLLFSRRRRRWPTRVWLKASVLR